MRLGRACWLVLLVCWACATGAQHDGTSQHAMLLESMANTSHAPDESAMNLLPSSVEQQDVKQDEEQEGGGGSGGGGGGGAVGEEGGGHAEARYGAGEHAQKTYDVNELREFAKWSESQVRPLRLPHLDQQLSRLRSLSDETGMSSALLSCKLAVEQQANRTMQYILAQPEVMMWRLQPGDHLKVRGVAGFRALTHHAIYLGDGKIMHFTGGVTDKANATCKIDSLRTIYNYGKAKGMHIEVVDHPPNALPREVIVERAKSRVGETGYNLFSKNCEHVVNWCIRGEMHSMQIQRLRSDPLGLGKEILQEQLEAGEGVCLEEICRTLLPPTVWQTAMMLQERVRQSSTVKKWKETIQQAINGRDKPTNTWEEGGE
ncbi:hypothetical protein GUITHDRAFT_142271 [Guillardia theta CCMP2712]|uniref:phospholipase A2 n=1 Tax=Guillardia theta (strain CCMP2712) TaxID=905079 RepID=L1IY05_GUITC|nr:hypothetical protein GUITHDRAFT_142271 [Guillardia theta CCMP2712]EKX41121.1 hypothetical protein GUITHDRAFT_142271 [Guillardia theta CCMP2712]|mmetsp:Transcript_5994/g.21123  ORF Transcript_5994/g.21123 Transcript_5994/m.21123 type:complete len:374 (-) Transcript_5994:1541-2662(-)|eukprot:XP_005828101.1 hypothetical protein GUITHDRAFT_142271 [Guillardia theta CCMP2712]